MTDEIAEDEPFAAFARWFELATKSEPLAETMTLATATRDGVPSVRAVLLKGFDQRGFALHIGIRDLHTILDCADGMPHLETEIPQGVKKGVG